MKTMVMGIFDVHVDSDHRWREDRAIKLDAYMITKRYDGKYQTDTSEPLASLRILAGPFEMNEWIDTKEQEKIGKLPPFVQHAYSAVVDAAKKAQMTFPVDIK